MTITPPTVDPSLTWRDLVLSDLHRYRPGAKLNWAEYLLRAPFHPGLLAGPIIRANQRLFQRGHSRAAYLMRTIGSLLFSVDIVPGTVIGKRMYMPHPAGVTLGFVTFGDDVTILQGVTAAAALHADGRVPHRGGQVGDGTSASAHVVIMDGVRVGAGVNIGANSVVLQDVRDGAVVVGAPAREVRSRPDGTAAEEDRVP